MEVVGTNTELGKLILLDQGGKVTHDDLKVGRFHTATLVFYLGNTQANVYVCASET